MLKRLPFTNWRARKIHDPCTPPRSWSHGARAWRRSRRRFETRSERGRRSYIEMLCNWIPTSINHLETWRNWSKLSNDFRSVQIYHKTFPFSSRRVKGGSYCRRREICRLCSCTEQTLELTFVLPTMALEAALSARSNSLLMVCLINFSLRLMDRFLLRLFC